MKIFIYGGTGYLGSSLISGLGKEHDFYVTSRKKKRNLIPNVKIFNENNEKKKILQKLKNSDLIIIANGPSFKDSIKNLYSYLKYLDEQVDLIIKLKKKNLRVIYFSSIHVYENYNSKRSKTSDLLNSRSHYSIRNIVCENLLLNRLSKKNLNIIRISNVFGIQSNTSKLKSNMFKLAVNQFCLSVIENKKILIESNLNEKRNFVSINDFVNFIKNGFILKKLKFNRIINYASKNDVSLKYIMHTIKSESKKLKIKIPKIVFLNKIKNSRTNYKFDIRDIEEKKLQPHILLKDEIKNTLKKIQFLK